MQNELPEWAVSAADEVWTALANNEASGREAETDLFARALVAAERRGIGRASPLARQLEKAVARAEDGAGALPARQAVKLRPSDWHRVTDLSRELAAAIRQLGETT